MFGTMGFSELIIILAIVFIIFGAGRLPQIGEGVGKALKGFKKEIHDIPQPPVEQVQQEPVNPQHPSAPPAASTAIQDAHPNVAPASPLLKTAAGPGPEMTPGTTASLLYNTEAQTSQRAHTNTQQQPQSAAMPSQHVVSMEERAATPAPAHRPQYPPLPAGIHQKPAAKRPSAIVNKDAVARVQAQQAALKAKTAQPPLGVSPDDMQRMGEGVGDVVRTFQQAVASVRTSIDPEMRTIQAEMDAAQKELEQSLESAKQAPADPRDLPRPS